MKFLILILVVAYVTADVSHIVGHKGSERDAKIVRQELDMGLEGNYQYVYETENGIVAQERGSLSNPQSDNASPVVEGQAQWTSPEGELIQLQYKADENGYQPQGSHIPTPPPIPEAIIKALEYIRAHPPPPENK